MLLLYIYAFLHSTQASTAQIELVYNGKSNS